MADEVQTRRAGEALEHRQRLAAVLLVVSIAAVAGWLVVNGRWLSALATLALGPLLHVAALLLEQAISAALSHRSDPIPPASWPLRLSAWVFEVQASMRVFYWEQPCRLEAFPPHQVVDRRSGQSPLLLIHGYLCNRAFWNPLRRSLHNVGLESLAITLGPAFAPIEHHGPAIEAAFLKLMKATGRAPVIVAHSMGGLAVRAWLASRPDDAHPPAAVVTVGTPHQGTWLARWSRQPNGRQMRLGSRWLLDLQRREANMPPRRFPWVCFFSNCDNVVFPVMCGALPGADNRHLPGQPHIRLLWHPEVLRVVRELARSD